MYLQLDNHAALMLILRIMLAILFVFQGYDKVINLGMKKVTLTFQYELGSRKIPRWVVFSAAVYTSYIELIGGILLLIGLFKAYALYLLGLDLVLVTIAFSIIYPMWDMKMVLPRLVLLAALLYLPATWDTCSLDYILNIK